MCQILMFWKFELESICGRIFFPKEIVFLRTVIKNKLGAIIIVDLLKNIAPGIIWKSALEKKFGRKIVGINFPIPQNPASV
jgi:hypothetical protein